DPARVCGGNLSGQVDVRTDEHRNGSRERFHYTQAKVFLIRRQDQQRCAAQHCFLSLALKPAGKSNTVRRSSPECVFRWSLACDDQSPVPKQALSREFDKGINENIQSLLRMQTRHDQHVMITTLFVC